MRKWILLNDDFLPMFVQTPKCPSCHADEILEMTEEGIIAEKGLTINLDLIVFATGFHIEGQLAKSGQICRQKSAVCLHSSFVSGSIT